MRRLLTFFLIGVAVSLVLTSCGSTAEPAAGKTFTQAIHTGNNAAARTVETEACQQSLENNFCLGAEYDAKVKALVKAAPISFAFVGTYTNAQGDTVVIYRVTTSSSSTHKTMTLTLILTVEKKTGKVGYANLSPDTAAQATTASSGIPN